MKATKLKIRKIGQNLYANAIGGWRECYEDGYGPVCRVCGRYYGEDTIYCTRWTPQNNA